MLTYRHYAPISHAREIIRTYTIPRARTETRAKNTRVHALRTLRLIQSIVYSNQFVPNNIILLVNGEDSSRTYTVLILAI